MKRLIAAAALAAASLSLAACVSHTTAEHATLTPSTAPATARAATVATVTARLGCIFSPYDGAPTAGARQSGNCQLADGQLVEVYSYTRRGDAGQLEALARSAGRADLVTWSGSIAVVAPDEPTAATVRRALA